MRNGEISFWHSQAPRTARPQLDGDMNADICIVGGGYTGLWTAFHARRRFPDARIVVVEKEHVGFGASGRNAGWLSPLVPGNRATFARSARSREAARLLQRRMIEAVDEVLEILNRNQLDARARMSGNIVVARTPAAMDRLRERRRGDLEWGYRDAEVAVLDETALADRIRVQGAVGGLFYPRAARVDPGRLVQELARLCEQNGVTILEGSEAVTVRGRQVVTPRGRVHADIVLRATEGYSGKIAERRREIIPINSSIIITRPVPESVWAGIGWNEYELVSDAAHVFSYLQKTDDGRILIGGRGTPYRFASGINADGTTDLKTVNVLQQRLHDLFPGVASVPIDHAWSGVLGVTRDWCATVTFDQSSGIGVAQGYAGHGVTSAYLAAKSLIGVIAGDTDGDAQLPWVGHRTRQWEPEPIRWTGVHAMYRLFSAADRLEERSGATATSPLATWGGKLAGLAE